MSGRSIGVRRANDTGTVYYDQKRERYRAQYYDNAGKRRSVSDVSREGIEKKFRTAMVARDNDTLTRSSSEVPKLSDWLTMYIDEQVPRLAISTVNRYRVSAKNISAHIGSQRLDRLDVQKIRSYQNRERGRGVSEGSLLNDYRLLKPALREAVDQRLIARNPMDGMKSPSPQRKPPNPLSESECASVLQAARRRGSREYALRLLNLIYGPRQGEVLGLTWLDIDFDQKTLRIERAARNDVGAGRYVKATKTADGVRTLRLDEETVSALRLWKSEQARHRLAATSWFPGDWVFTTRFGRPLDAHRDHRLWKSLLKDAGVREVRLHDARHTAGSLMNALGADARTIQKTLGHSDVHTTLTFYVTPTDALLAAATQRVADRICL